jgi:hypothetical protein
MAIGRSRRRAIRPKQRNAGLRSAFRTLLDFRVARIAYRATRAAWADLCLYLWAVWYGDADDRHWTTGVVCVCVLLVILLSLPW